MKKELAIIAGGTGTVGSGIVKEFLRLGYEVVVLSRNKAKLTRLPKNVESVQVDFSDFTALKNIAKKYKKIDVMVVSLGGWYVGKNLLEHNSAKISGILSSNIMPHYNLVKLFAGITKNYIIINGEAGFTPALDAGISSITDAALNMMFKVVAAENPKFRMAQVVICASVNSNELPAQEVGAAIHELAQNKIKNGEIVFLGERATVTRKKSKLRK